jgi:uncharacterized hydrophobic protein (TIGR00271 family)
MPSVTGDDIVRMREQLFFEGPQKSQRLSRFWLLLGLSAVIASAGVVGDSTATVIGAMIVAPLMAPILGTMLAVVLGERANLARCLLLVVGGSLVVIGLGWLLGYFVDEPVLAATNTQVAARVSPRLVDLVAAIATGAVGSVALVREDISDTLPGVAIAISLVPPLAVVGLTWQSGAHGQALGALLLFVSNVNAILVTGLLVMVLYRVHRAADQSLSQAERGMHRGRASAVIVASLVVVAIPLTLTSARISSIATTESGVAAIASRWAKADHWEVVGVTTEPHDVLVRVTGSPPGPDTTTLRMALDSDGFGATHVKVELIPSRTVDRPGG